MAQRNTTKVALSVLALGGATAAVVFGSWAAWTAQTTNPGNTVTAGTLSLDTDKSGVEVFDVSGVKPGQSGSETVTVANTSDIDLALTLSQDAVVQNASSALKFRIHDGTNCVYPAAVGACVAYGAWDGSATIDSLAQGTLQENGTAGDSKTYTVGWTLESGSTNGDQGTVNSFTLTWDGAPA